MNNCIECNNSHTSEHQFHHKTIVCPLYTQKEAKCNGTKENVFNPCPDCPIDWWMVRI